MIRDDALTRIADLGYTRDTFLDAFQSRQAVILGEERCRLLRDKTVAIAGIGGGGCLTLELLVRAGIGRFRLLDMDVYDITNLNRHLYATPLTLGRPKVEVAAEHVHEVNPFAEVEMAVHAPASSDNVAALLEGADIGMVCTDFPSSMRFFERHARRLRLPLVAGWCTPAAAGIWVLDFRRDESTASLLAPMRWKRVAKRVLGREWTDLTDDEIYALDARHRAPGATTPSIGYTANVGACLAVGAAVGILTGSEGRLDSMSVDFARMVVGSV